MTCQKKIIVLFLLAGLCFLMISGTDNNFYRDLMSCTHQMQEILGRELELVRALQNHSSIHQDLDQLLKHYYDSDYFAQVEQDPEMYISHPINALGVIKRTLTIKAQWNVSKGFVSL